MPGHLHAALLAATSLTPKVLTFQGSNHTTTSGSSTYTSAPIGTAAANRYVIVTISVSSTTATTTVSGVTCGGVAMTQITQANATDSAASVWGLLVPSGTTATIVATFSTGTNGASIGVYSLTGITSLTPVGTASQTANNTATALTTVAGGVAVAIVTVRGGTNYTWTGDVTEDWDLTGTTTQGGASATATASTSISITVNAAGSFTGGTFIMAAASW